MRYADWDLARPHRARDFELVRAGAEGTYWHGPDGMVVRLAAPERARMPMREAEWRHTFRADFEVALGRSGPT